MKRLILIMFLLSVCVITASSCGNDDGNNDPFEQFNCETTTDFCEQEVCEFREGYYWLIELCDSAAWCACLIDCAETLIIEHEAACPFDQLRLARSYVGYIVCIENCR